MESSFNPYNLPNLNKTFRIPYTKGLSIDQHQFFDIRFYPYHTTEESAPIFAVVGCLDVVIYRAASDEDGFIRIHHLLRDQEKKGAEALPVLNTCSWAFIDQSEPLLAVSGASGQIKVFNTLTGDLFTTLVGHGESLINDLATHPLYPWILASCSVDTSIRIWDLRRWNDNYESPCIAICGQGQGHKEGILKIAWHSTGKYIISGAHDYQICVWTIPDLSPDSPFWSDISKESRKRESDAVKVIHYPHFVSASIHKNYVDCVAFYGDLILSKAAADEDEDKTNWNEISLWKITGFDSTLPRPHPDLAPKTQEHKDTRSGFHRQQTKRKSVLTNGSSPTEEDTEIPPYVRILNFELPHTKSFYIRFGLLRPSPLRPDLNPILACGNMKSQIYFWDLSRLEHGHTQGFKTFPHNPPKHEKYFDKPIARRNKNRQPASLISQRNSTPQSLDTASESTFDDGPVEPDRVRYNISDLSFASVKPHKTITLPNVMKGKEGGTCFRALDWSSCGKYCVVVGDSNGDGSGAFMTRWI